MLSSTLDFQLALNAVNGNADLANDLLKTLLSQLEDYKKIISKALQTEDRQQLQDTIHKINGAMQYVGAPTLAALVADLDGQILVMQNTILKVQIQQVLDAIEQIIQLGGYPPV